SWLGLEYDQGPFYQSRRFDRYKEVIEQLRAAGQAYFCYCSKEELDQMRTEQMQKKLKPRYDGRCRDRSQARAGVSPVIRFRNPADGEVVFDDLVKGRITVRNAELDDLIIARSDASPTYNLAVVVDDLDMGISHVVRGDDHINNTPRQINILKALNAPIPQYGHLPMILGADAARLSKRHGAVSVMQYKDDGYLPEALLNYLVRLGWSHGDREVFSIDEMIELFEITDVNLAPSTFNPEKLLWLNHQYIKNADPARVAHHLGWHLGQLDIDPSQGPEVLEVVKAQRERSRTLAEMAASSAFFYKDFEDYDALAANKNLNPEALGVLEKLKDRFSALPTWRAQEIHAIIEQVVEASGLKFGKVAQPLRVAVAGSTASPAIDVTLELVGHERTLARLDRAIRFIQSGQGIAEDSD
ncbi:MAG: glutamate--tRNA ligase, partial [Methylococcales bacterium]